MLTNLEEELRLARAELEELRSRDKEPLRLIWAKLVQMEKKIDALTPAVTGVGQASLALPGAGKRKPGNPEHTLLQGRLTAAWLKAKGQRYSFEGGKDAKAISQLLKRGMTIDQLVARWEWAFKNGCVSIFDFNVNFNRYVPVQATHRPQVSGGVDLYAPEKK